MPEFLSSLINIFVVTGMFVAGIIAICSFLVAIIFIIYMIAFKTVSYYINEVLMMLAAFLGSSVVLALLDTVVLKGC